MMDVLFQKDVPVSIASEQDLHQKHVSILTVRITLVPKKILELQLTDDKDSFFLFSLQISEVDFQTLKREQSLSFDFPELPNQVIDLLETCIKHAAAAQSPPEFPYQCQLTGNTLAFVQVAKTRPLHHLVLQMKPANDSMLKRYLADRVKEFKDLSNRLQVELDSTRQVMESKVTDLEKKLENALKSRDTIDVEHSKIVSELKMQYNSLLNDEKQKSIEHQREWQLQFEREGREKEKRYEQQILLLKSQIDSLQTESNQLSSVKIQLESEVENLLSKLHQTEMESQRTKAEGINEYNIKMVSIAQKLKDKEDLVAQMSAHLESSNARVADLEESVVEAKAKRMELEEKITLLKQEISKGNQIIQQLQTQLKGFKEKTKLKSALVTKLEETVQEKQNTIDKQNTEITSLKQQLNDKKAECERLQHTVERHVEELEKDKELLEQNQKMINWLNSELNQKHIQPILNSVVSALPATTSIAPHPTKMPSFSQLLNGTGYKPPTAPSFNSSVSPQPSIPSTRPPYGMPASAVSPIHSSSAVATSTPSSTLSTPTGSLEGSNSLSSPTIPKNQQAQTQPAISMDSSHDARPSLSSTSTSISSTSLSTSTNRLPSSKTTSPPVASQSGSSYQFRQPYKTQNPEFAKYIVPSKPVVQYVPKANKN